MRKEILSVAIVGHVDHGKSTLIGRLLLDTRSLPDGKMNELKEIARQLGQEAELAHLADQLKEERLKEATIDTTQLFFATRCRSYCIIDTPGHVEFLKNMISGSSLADCAILMVDAQEGIKEQTRRHLFLLKMLGITQVIVAVNKMDRVGYDEERFSELTRSLGALIEALGLPSVYFVPLSAKEGDNVMMKSAHMRWYRGKTLCEHLDGLRNGAHWPLRLGQVFRTGAHWPLRLGQVFRTGASATGQCVLPVQDVYEIDGERVIVGTLVHGTMAAGQEVTLLPAGTAATIEKILVFGKKKLRLAHTGESIGVMLRGASFLARGDVIVDSKSPLQPVRRLRANVFWLSGESLRVPGELMMRISTQEVRCSVTLIERRINSSTLEVLEENGGNVQRSGAHWPLQLGQVRQNEAASVVITAEQPFIAERFARLPELGRFVLESDHVLRGVGTVAEVMAA